MADIIDVKNFGIEDVKKATSGATELMKNSGVDDKWVKIAEYVDHAISKVAEIVVKKQGEAPTQDNGVKNVSETATPKQFNPQIAWEINKGVEDLKILLKTQTAVPLDLTLNEILEDESLNALLKTSIAQKNIADFLNNYVRIYHD